MASARHKGPRRHAIISRQALTCCYAGVGSQANVLRSRVAAVPRRVVAPILSAVVVLAVILGASWWPEPASDDRATSDGERTSVDPDDLDLGSVDLDERVGEQVSRSVQRPSPVAPPGQSGVAAMTVPPVTGQQWTTTTLNIWSGPGEHSSLTGQLDTAVEVDVTGQEVGGWAQIVLDGMPRWVDEAYLSSTDPAPDPVLDPVPNPTQDPEPLPDPDPVPDSDSDPDSDRIVPDEPTSAAPCHLGTGIESGLTADTVEVYRAVCAAFPQLSSVGGLRPGDGGAHGSGQALDLMTTDQALGDQIAAWAIANHAELGISEIIWYQRIWATYSMAWESMEDRGSTTANHYDHVHLTVYG